MGRRRRLDLNRLIGPGNVETKNPIHMAPVIREWQTQPEQDDMVTTYQWPMNDAMPRSARLGDAAMDTAPVRRGVSTVYVGETSSRELLTVDFTQARPGERERTLVHPVSEID